MIGQHPVDEVDHVERHTVGIEVMAKCPVHVFKMPGRQKCKITTWLENGDDLTRGQRVEAAGK